MPRKKGLQIEYADDVGASEFSLEDDRAPASEPVDPIIEVEAIEEEEELEAVTVEVVDESVPEDLNDYVYHERVGTLDLINYLPRIPKAVLAGERDFTEKEWAIASEDLARGFRPIEKHYSAKYQVPENAACFRTQEDLSRDIAKVSPGLIGKWVKVTTRDTPRRFPEGLLKDDFGFTQYAVAIYRNLMRYTCTRRFIANENGLIDWDNIDRDGVPPPLKNPELSEDNPDYALSSFYWEKLQEQWEDYRDRMAWLTEYKQARTLREQEPEVMDFGNEDRELGQQLSQFAARVELGKQLALEYLDKELGDLTKQAVHRAKQSGAKARTEAIEAFAESFNQGDPQPLEEEEDLWSGE